MAADIISNIAGDQAIVPSSETIAVSCLPRVDVTVECKTDLEGTGLSYNNLGTTNTFWFTTQQMQFCNSSGICDQPDFRNDYRSGTVFVVCPPRLHQYVEHILTAVSSRSHSSRRTGRTKVARYVQDSTQTELSAYFSIITGSAHRGNWNVCYNHGITPALLQRRGSRVTHPDPNAWIQCGTSERLQMPNVSHNTLDSALPCSCAPFGTPA
jgi:hypothetical protein